MVKEQPRDRFNWWLLVFGAVGALIATSALAAYVPDIGQIFYFFIVAPSFSLILIVFAIWKRRSKARGSILLMLVPFWVVTVEFYGTHLRSAFLSDGSFIPKRTRRRF
jgi:hypothetical protein